MMAKLRRNFFSEIVTAYPENPFFQTVTKISTPVKESKTDEVWLGLCPFSLLPKGCLQSVWVHGCPAEVRREGELDCKEKTFRDN